MGYGHGWMWGTPFSWWILWILIITTLVVAAMWYFAVPREVPAQRGRQLWRFLNVVTPPEIFRRRSSKNGRPG